MRVVQLSAEWEFPFQVGKELLATVCLSLELTLELQTLRHLLAICCPSFVVLVRPRVLLQAEKYILCCKHERTGDQVHGSCKGRGEGSCMRVSNDVDRVFPLQHFMHIISVPCNFEMYPPVCKLEEQLLKHGS